MKGITIICPTVIDCVLLINSKSDLTKGQRNHLWFNEDKEQNNEKEREREADDEKRLFMGKDMPIFVYQRD
jgi:hypothetical protein